LGKQLIPIFLVVVVDVLGLSIILPLLPFYAEKLGASPLVVGLLISSYAACQLIAGPILGRLSDRYGRRPLLLISQLGTFLSFILLANAATLPLVFFARILDGFTAGNLSLAQAYIADVTKPEERTHSFALIGIAFGLGFLVGPAISGFLAQFNYVYPIYAAAALSAASIAATWLFLPNAKPSVTGQQARMNLLDVSAFVAYFRQPILGKRLLQFVFFTFSFSTFFSGFALFAERRFTYNGQPFGPKEVGYIYAFVGVLGIIEQGFFIRPMVKRYGDAPLVGYGFLSGLIGFVWLGFVFDLPGLLAAAAIASLGSGALRPALTSLITQSTEPSEQGSVLGLTQSLQSLSQIAAPFFAGLLIEHGHLLGWAILAAVPNLFALLVRVERKASIPTHAD
jgi:MFS transporter, DHA1 family, tetracycline resistance protein